MTIFGKGGRGKTWTLAHASRLVEVSGFKKGYNARRHAVKHFLDPREQWEDLTDNPLPQEFVKRLGFSAPIKQVALTKIDKLGNNRLA